MRTLTGAGMIAIVVMASSCGRHALPTAADFPSQERWTLSASETAPEVDALVGRFHDEPFDRLLLERDLEALLERYPRSWELHHIAGYLALLNGDSHGVWAHFMAAAADLRCPYPELYLWEALSEPRIVSEYSGTIELLEQMAREHPVPRVRLVAARRLAGDFRRYNRLEEADAVTARLGFLDQWMVIGAFENDQGSGFLTPYLPEESIDLDEEVPGRLRPVRWREVELIDEAGRVPLSEMVSPDEWSVAYLLTYVQSPAQRTAQLRLTTGTSVRVWVNDALVVSEEHVEGGDLDNVVVPVTLARGWNKVLVKSASRSSASGWYLGAFITDEDGAPLRDLTQSRSPHPFSAAEEPAEPAPLITEPSSLESIESEGLRRVLSIRSLERAGLNRRALPLAQQLVTNTPDHPLHVLLSALVHWDNDELGRTIDLLNQAAALTEDWGAGVLTWRARFYSQRGLLDRAIADLRDAIEENPGARLSRMRLAEAFEQRGWNEDRCRVLEEVIERWPDNGWAMRDMAQCLRARGYQDQALSWQQRARALEPGQEWGLRRLAAFALMRFDYDEAVALCEARRAVIPTRTDAIVECGNILRIAGRREEARAQFEEARGRDPDWSVPFNSLAVMAYEDDDDERALRLWRAALERSPDDTALAERLSFLESERMASVRRYIPTDQEIEENVARAPTVELAPGAHRVALFDHEVTVVRNDGSSDRTITQVWLVATTDGRDRLLRYEAPRTARILQAYSRDPDGRRQEASSIRDGTIRFRRLDVGSVVVIQYIFHDRPGRFLPNHFVTSWWFNGVNWQREGGAWVILLPLGRQLSFHISGDIEHEHRTEGTWEVHTFQSGSLPPLIPEPAAPPIIDVVAHVSVSTVPSWDEYVQWERALLTEAFETAPELRELAQQLTDGVDGTRARLDRLFRFVAQEIRYQQDYEDSIAGVRPHSSTVVLERRYGDCKDKAVLLIQLARELGIELQYVLLRTTSAGEVEPEVPNQQFNHAIVYVPEQVGIDEAFFMDPTTDGLDIGTLRGDDQDALALVLDTETGAHRFIRIPFQGT